VELEEELERDAVDLDEFIWSNEDVWLLGLLNNGDEDVEGMEGEIFDAWYVGEWYWLLLWSGILSSNKDCAEMEYAGLEIFSDDAVDWYGKICSKNITSLEMKISLVSKSNKIWPLTPFLYPR